jgi:glycosyltransferase involved in cell wall biosynthesis
MGSRAFRVSLTAGPFSSRAAAKPLLREEARTPSPASVILQGDSPGEPREPASLAGRADTEHQHIDISIVIPMRDEAANVATVCAELREVIDGEPLRYEVIVVNDGSTDATGAQLEAAVSGDPRFTVVEFARGFGQSAALDAGFRMARGAIVVAMDGDQQNDPHDIPALVEALDEPPGWDVVSGWRKDRKDTWWSRRLPSMCANFLVRHVTSCPEIHDFGCTLKAYRQEVLTDVRLYGEIHRFLPAICKWRGARISERVVNHRSRVNGQTKYNIKRTGKVLFDLLTMTFLGGYLTKPIYFFGKLASLALLVTVLSLGMAVLQKLGYLTEHGQPISLNDNIFVIFGMMMTVMTMGLLMMGLMCELLIRIYHESQDRPPYRIRRIVRADGPPRAEPVPEQVGTFTGTLPGW